MTEDQKPREEDKENKTEEPNLLRDKEKDKDKRRKEKNKTLTKVVIRCLPPTMVEDSFKKQIEPIPDHDFFYYVPADWSLGQNASSRAYINFMNQEDIFIFKDKFDGYVFVDERGAEHYAVVEFAPFQGFPRNKSRKKDNKCGTIEEELHYLKFIESLKSEEGEGGKGENKLEYSYQIKDDKKIITTPLLEYIANKKQEKRDERKRKSDEKKRKRDEERQKKKQQVAKLVPVTIQEEPVATGSKEADDDGIIVRTVKSCLGRDRKNRRERKTERSEKTRDDRMKEVKVEKRNDRRDRSRERNATSNRKKSLSNTDIKYGEELKENEKDVGNSDRGKSRRQFRKDRRNQKEMKEDVQDLQEDDITAHSVILQQENNEGSNMTKYQEETNNLQSENQADMTNKVDKDKDKELRSQRRIRNKDRPALQIYQPGKSRLQVQKKKEGEDSPNQAPPTESTKVTESTSINDKRVVSRYSERRKKTNDTNLSNTKSELNDQAQPTNENAVNEIS